MVADYPEAYAGQKEFDFIKRVPCTWDEVRSIGGMPMQWITLARRSGNDWYVGAMTDWTPRDLDIDFSFLPDGEFHMQSYEDGANADRMGADYKMKKSSVNKSTKLKVHLAPGGGWAARITP